MWSSVWVIHTPYEVAALSAGESCIGLVDSFGALVEEFLFGVVEVEFNDFFDTVAAEDTGHTDAEVFFTIFAVEQS